MPKTTSHNLSALYQRPVELLQQLIRFDTTNPPGNEAGCIQFIDRLLKGAGFQTRLAALTPRRPNLITRLKGQGKAPPLLLYGHVDVVTTANQDWKYPPFEAVIADGCVWGRGALDMKGGVAMMLAALLRARSEGMRPAGDVILAVVSDEEAGGDFGSRFLVEKHPQLFAGARYALGEIGGFIVHLGKRTFIPIMIAEKQLCWMKATLRGPGGHGSMPVKGGAMARMARMVTQLDRTDLPVHITPPARMMFDGMAAALSGPLRLFMRFLTMPWMVNTALKMIGKQARLFSPLLHNTVSPSIVHASDKINVIPGQVVLEIDGRLLPGYKPADMLDELRRILGDDVELEVVRHDPGPAEPDMGLFDTLAGILCESVPDGVAVPYLMSGVTDARFFSRLGIQTYGFLPMHLPPGLSFTEAAHAANEHVLVDAVAFGADAIFKAMQRFG